MFSSLNWKNRFNETGFLIVIGVKALCCKNKCIKHGSISSNKIFQTGLNKRLSGGMMSIICGRGFRIFYWVKMISGDFWNTGLCCFRLVLALPLANLSHRTRKLCSFLPTICMFMNIIFIKLNMTKIWIWLFNYGEKKRLSQYFTIKYISQSSFYKSKLKRNVW